jgi:Zn-dependent protease with chaperone function
MIFDSRLRSPKERPLFVLSVIVSSAVWLSLLVSLVGIPFALGGLAFVLIAHAVYLAHVRGNGVRLSEKQLPELYRQCQAAAYKLGLSTVPDIYVVQSGGLLNAFATRLISRKYVVLFSELVNQCEDQRQLDFVIGHEMGHLAAGHLAWNAFLAPAQLVPWLGPAFSRAREYTSDRCGFAVVGQLEPALRGLAVLAAGGRLAGALDLAEFVRQRDESGRFWMAVRELCSSHPYLCKRAAALQELVTPGAAQPVGRNPLAYPLAPLFGITAGGASSLAMLMLIYFAVCFGVLSVGMRARQGAAQAAAATQRLNDFESPESR